MGFTGPSKMKLQFFLIFMIIKNIFSYNHQSPIQEMRQIQSSKKFEQVTGNQRRHHISMPISFSETAPVDCFPEIEYPTSVLESEPFFYKSNDVLEPFQDDVKLCFKSLAKESNKLKPTPVTITPTVKPNIVNAIEEKPIAVTTSNNTLTNVIPSENLDFELDNKEPFVKLNDTTIEEKQRVETTSNDNFMKDVYGAHVEYDLDEVKKNISQSILNFQEEKTTASMTSNKTVIKEISNAHIDNEFDDTTIEEKPRVETNSNDTVIKDVYGKHVEYDLDEGKKNVNQSILNIQEDKLTGNMTSNKNVIKEISNAQIDNEFDDEKENLKQTIVNNDEEKQTTANISNHTAIKDKSNKYMDYDFDDAIGTLAEFTSIEQPAYTHDVNSQMVSDDMFPEMSDENSFYPADDSQEQTTTENSNMLDVLKSSASNNKQKS